MITYPEALLIGVCAFLVNAIFRQVLAGTHAS